MLGLLPRDIEIVIRLPVEIGLGHPVGFLLVALALCGIQRIRLGTIGFRFRCRDARVARLRRHRCSGHYKQGGHHGRGTHVIVSPKWFGRRHMATARPKFRLDRNETRKY